MRLSIFLIGMSVLLFCGCSEPVKREQLNGYWLHNFEREGIDFSPEGVVARYHLSPRKIELYTFEFTPDSLALDDVSTRKVEEEEWAFTLDGTHFQLEPTPGEFQNFTKYSLPEAPTLMPEIVGLWKTETKGSKAFWNFTEWGTVFARVELTPGRYEALWAKYQLKSEPGGFRTGIKRKVVLWGVQGDQNLSGEEVRVKLNAGNLEIDQESFVRLTSAEALGSK